MGVAAALVLDAVVSCRCRDFRSFFGRSAAICRRTRRLVAPPGTNTLGVLSEPA